MAARRALLLVLLAALAVSGCTDPAPAQASGGDAGPAAADAAPMDDQPLRTFSEPFDLHLSEANAGGLRQGLPPFLPVASSNCVELPAGTLVRAGEAVATWTAQSPAAQQLLLVLDHGPGPEHRITAEGPSPLTLDLSGIELGSIESAGTGGEREEGSLLMVSLAGPAAAAVDQPVSLVLRMQYPGAEDISVATGRVCSPFT